MSVQRTVHAHGPILTQARRRIVLPPFILDNRFCREYRKTLIHKTIWPQPVGGQDGGPLQVFSRRNRPISSATKKSAV